MADRYLEGLRDERERTEWVLERFDRVLSSGPPTSEWDMARMTIKHLRSTLKGVRNAG